MRNQGEENIKLDMGDFIEIVLKNLASNDEEFSILPKTPIEVLTLF